MPMAYEGKYSQVIEKLLDFLPLPPSGHPCAMSIVPHMIPGRATMHPPTESCSFGGTYIWTL